MGVRIRDLSGLGFDWRPDHCHGGVGLIALQAMLMQCEDEKIILFPAWPETWDVSFKLHAPYQTTVERVYRNGRLKRIKVEPESRGKDMILSPGVKGTMSGD
jgi:hypothetical protein